MKNTNILQYESKIWATADLLRGCGIKESEYPAFMMPFFALVMIESRLIRMLDDLKSEYGEAALAEIDKEDLYDLIKDKKQGYNVYIFEKNKTLKDICLNDKSFNTDLDAYLHGFDGETKDLLGVDATEGEKFLDMKGVMTKLNAKKVLFAYAKEWSGIDLKPFNNSEITTLEEHIKRKWADISAETAGEQYTPDDVIALIAEIIASKIEESDKLLTIYDCTCGGGNLLFGVEDRINEKFERFTQTYGQDWNDSLYALAKIESRFRLGSQIEHGNTLVSSEFYNDTFDVIVANPPYGVSWKGYQSDVERDTTGQFHYLPSISDGQLLFMQHLISKLKDGGMGVVVHNGSTLFSGDAGSAESNIRKWMLDADIVEAIIQLPTDEFFNTGIYTYLWVLNKNKQLQHKDKVMLGEFKQTSSKFHEILRSESLV
jgi:type I restriction enzyme M protein